MPSDFRSEIMQDILGCATNRLQWIALYEDGSVRIVVNNRGIAKNWPYRYLDYRLKSDLERKAISTLIGHLNMASEGREGNECEIPMTFR